MPRHGPIPAYWRVRRRVGVTAAQSTLIIGGAASGKSAHAEAIVAGTGLPPVYVATAEALDDEMAARISAHRARRGSEWTTIEAPLDPAAALLEATGKAVLVDCLTMWLSNLLSAGRDAAAETEKFLTALAAAPGPVVLVANEIGLGIVPETATAREFRDRHGALNQAVAAAADRVVFVAAGLPLSLKGA